jgi:hypothetical protein
MAINSTLLTTRLGKLVYGLNLVNTYQNTTIANRFTTIYNEYTSSLGDEDLADNLWATLTGTQNANATATTYFAKLASNSIRRAVENDRPGLGKDIVTALTEWVRQLNVAGQTLQQSTVTISGVSTLTDGNGVLVVLAPGDLVYPDVVLGSITNDQSTGAAKFSETASFTGTGTVTPQSWLWPQGSGVASSLRVIDPALNVGITNGSFLSWVSTDVTPTGWKLSSGTNNPTRITTTTGVRGDQPYPEWTASGSAYQLDNFSRQLVPNAQYAISVHLKRNGSVTAGGNLAIKVGGVTVFSLDPAAFTTSWVQYSGAVQAPIITAGVPAVSIVENGAVPAGGKYDIAYVAIQQLQPLTPAGIYAALFSGSAAFTTRDKFTITTALVSGTMSGSLLRGIDRLVDIRDTGLVFPTTTGGSATYPDTLVS